MAHSASAAAETKPPTPDEAAEKLLAWSWVEAANRMHRPPETAEMEDQPQAAVDGKLEGQLAG